MKDAEWIADLVRHGLVKASYIPSREQRELREMTRYRQEIIEERTLELNRIQSVLEVCNIKLGNVINLAKGKARNKLPEMCKALEGRVLKHQRKMPAKK